MPFGRPFRAISLCVSFPGLKPWAVFCSPVGRLELAQENVQTSVPALKRRAEPRSPSIGACCPNRRRPSSIRPSFRNDFDPNRARGRRRLIASIQTVAQLDSPVPQSSFVLTRFAVVRAKLPPSCFLPQIVLVVVVLRSRPFPGAPSETPQSVTDHEDHDNEEG